MLTPKHILPLSEIVGRRVMFDYLTTKRDQRETRVLDVEEVRETVIVGKDMVRDGSWRSFSIHKLPDMIYDATDMNVGFRVR